jgi:hypothetical protein
MLGLRENKESPRASGPAYTPSDVNAPDAAAKLCVAIIFTICATSHCSQAATKGENGDVILIIVYGAHCKHELGWLKHTVIPYRQSIKMAAT